MPAKKRGKKERKEGEGGKFNRPVPSTVAKEQGGERDEKQATTMLHSARFARVRGRGDGEKKRDISHSEGKVGEGREGK